MLGAQEPENRADMRFDKSDLPLYELIAQLLKLRAQRPSLSQGSSQILTYERQLLVIARIYQDEITLLLINTGASATQWELPEAWGSPQLTQLLTQEQLTGPVTLPASSVQLLGLQLTDRAPSSSTHEPTLVRFSTQCPLNPGEHLHVVGAAPELGQWDPNQAPGPFVERHDAQALELSFTPGIVLAYKLVATSPDNTRWEEGQNRFVFIPPQQEALEIELDCHL